MTDDIKTHAPDDPQHPNNLVVLGPDGDPLPHPTGTKMIERESYERVIEGLKMAADACVHLAKRETVKASIWQDIGKILDKMRRDAVTLGGIDLAMKQSETSEVRGAPYSWRKARERFLDGIKQATGGMRQLATCFRADFHWSFMAQQLERHEKRFRELLLPEIRLAPTPRAAKGLITTPVPKLIVPPGFARQ
jgi:hypothetical protein